jgi:hypothetical protein
MGHPRLIWVLSKSESRSKATGGSVCSIRATGNGKGNVNVKSGAAGVRGSHFSQRTREVGHPCLIWGLSKSESRSKATGRSVCSTLATGNGKGNINVKSGADGVRGSHPSTGSGQAFSQRTREMEHPRLIWGLSESESRSKAAESCVRSTWAESTTRVLVEIPYEVDGTRCG